VLNEAGLVLDRPAGNRRIYQVTRTAGAHFAPSSTVWTERTRVALEHRNLDRHGDGW